MKRSAGNKRRGRVGAIDHPSRAAAALAREFGASAVETALARADAALEAGNGAEFQAWLEVAGAIQDAAALGRKIPGAARDQDAANTAQKNA